MDFTDKEIEAYRLAAACEKQGVVPGSPTAQWIFQCCGLWNELQSLGRKIQKQQSDFERLPDYCELRDHPDRFLWDETEGYVRRA